MFSTLITRRPVYSSVSFWSPLVNAEEPPMVPDISNGLAGPLMGTARRFTRDPPSSKLDW